MDFTEHMDVFGRDRETTFRYVWEESPVPTLAGKWGKCGKPEENHET